MGGKNRAPDRKDVDPIELASRDEITALQVDRLKATLVNAYENVGHYRKAFDAAGVHPDDFKDLSDLERFPFTQKSDLRDNYPFGMFAVPREQIVRVHASSGTTGKSTVVGYTRQDIENWADMIIRVMRNAGGRDGDILHVAYGYGLFTGGLGFHDGGTKMGLTVVPMSGGSSDRQVQLIQDFGAHIVAVTPSYMLALCDEFDRQGIDPRKTDLRVGIHGAEPWTLAMREEIEARTGIDAMEVYGLSELVGPGVAGECLETKDGPMVFEDYFYPEIIDPETGKVLPDGEQGELVFTTLTKEAQPIIRYRTRDLSRLLPPTARSFRRQEKIAGRTDDMMIIRGVNVFPSQIEVEILKQPALSPHYQIELSRDGPMDAIAVVVEARPELSGQGEAARAKEAAALTRSIKSFVGVSAKVRVVPVDGVERSMGKAVRIKDLRK